MISYCESLRGELRRSGVKVVTIAPGYIDTPLTRGNRYAMPFLMSAEDFADRASARHRRAARATASFPGRWAIVAKLLRLLPNALFDRAARGPAAQEAPGPSSRRRAQ